MSNAEESNSKSLAKTVRLELRDTGFIATLLAVYVGLEWLSFLHEHNDLPVTPWNPGLGVMFAMIILRGPKMGAVLLVGVLLAQLLVVRSELSWGVLLAMSGAISLSYTSVAVVARRALALGPQLLRTRDILILVAAGLAGALAEAVQLWLLLLTTRHFQFGDLGSTSVPLIVGDVIGIAVLAPLFLRMAAKIEQRPPISRGEIAELAALTVAIAIILLIVVRPAEAAEPSLFYLMFVPVVIAAVRHGIDGACGALAISQLGLVAFLHLYGFDLSRFTEYQLLMLVLTITGLIVGALVSERHAAHLAAEAARLRLAKLEAEAARTARLNMASGMAAALSHEINQPMTAARALARSVQELMRSPERDGARMERNLASMVDQIDHAAAVIKSMREFLRRGEPHVSTLDMRRVIEEAVALLEPSLSTSKVQLALDLPAEIPAVHGDRVQIGQVLINLIKNSIDALSSGTQGQISVTLRKADNGNFVEISVRDNGSGVSEEQAAALFEPLNTSKPDGIGLGLSISQTIVQSHGGRIWVASSLPGQTEFKFALPAVKTA